MFGIVHVFRDAMFCYGQVTAHSSAAFRTLTINLTTGISGDAMAAISVNAAHRARTSTATGRWTCTVANGAVGCSEGVRISHRIIIITYYGIIIAMCDLYGAGGQ